MELQIKHIHYGRPNIGNKKPRLKHKTTTTPNKCIQQAIQQRNENALG